jgi:predicted regulator of Ras-like GTPase activity (Roadblock/LC7/MglB family)
VQVETEIERLRKKLENFPSASLYNRLAELARQAGDDAEAEAVCRRCVREFPRSGQSYVILAEIKIAQSKKAEAIHLLQTGIEKDPRSYAAHRLMSELADTKEQALHHLRQILLFKPSDPATVQRIAELGGKVPGGTTARHRSVSVAAATNPPAPAVLPPPPVGTPAHRPTIVPRQPPVDANAPLPFLVGPSAASARPSSPGVATTLLRSIGSSKAAVLDALCMEAGVRGAAIVDDQGRVVVSRNLPAGQDELLAALAADILKTTSATLAATGAGVPATWVLVAVGGQVLTFSRDRTLSVVVLADPGVRPAMLELRARQALIDLGAA